ncbi:MAG: hypothetical protein KDC57_17215, partial [Saprospiraceae bacterium]|nr:hypothetical protein [Saprospiraceae bacterium]
VASIFIFKEGSPDWEQWVASADTSYSVHFSIPYNDNPIFRDLEKARQSGESFYTVKYPKEVKDEWFKYAFVHTDYQRIPAQRKDYLLDSDFYLVAFALSTHTGIQLAKYEGDAFSDQDHQILQQFNRVFEQAYIRFLDLQKAEAQTREAQIEIALEKVRARSMAMHKADELADVSMLLFDQVQTLGIKPRSCGFLIMNEEKENMEDWSANLDEHGGFTMVVGTLSFNQHPMLKDVVETWKRGDSYFIGSIHGEALQEYYQAVTNQESTSKEIQEKVLSKAQSEYTNSFYFEFGMMYILTADPLEGDQIQVLLRFANVFKLTYRRFLDLQKAEAQAREAKIEAALERVRAKTMAMHTSNELRQVVAEYFRQAQWLGIQIRMFVIFIFKPDGGMEWWGTEFGEEGLPQCYDIPPLDNLAHPRAKNLSEIREKKLPYQVFELAGREKQSWIEFLFQETGLHQLPETIKEGMRAVDKVVLSDAVCNHGILEVAGPSALSNEHAQILQRFANVFDLTYTRFLDVQKAEEQAREAQIEAALERVRARTMAMHSSQDVGATVALLFDELIGLGLGTQARCGIGIFNETSKMELWTASTESNGKVILNVGHIDMTKHPLLQGGKQAWEKRKSGFSYVLEGDDLVRYFTIINEEPDYSFHVDLSTLPSTFHFNEFVFSDGILYAFTREPLAEEMAKICKRFTQVFGQTYRRY